MVGSGVRRWPAGLSRVRRPIGREEGPGSCHGCVSRAKRKGGGCTAEMAVARRDVAKESKIGSRRRTAAADIDGIDLPGGRDTRCPVSGSRSRYADGSVYLDLFFYGPRGPLSSSSFLPLHFRASASLARETCLRAVADAPVSSSHDRSRRRSASAFGTADSGCAAGRRGRQKRQIESRWISVHNPLVLSALCWIFALQHGLFPVVSKSRAVAKTGHFLVATVAPIARGTEKRNGPRRHRFAESPATGGTIRFYERYGMGT